MKNRKPKIIKDKKLRGEWAESVFMARAGERGLQVSKPWGESSSYDFVVGTKGKFVSVQVKSTTFKIETGYDCTIRGSGHTEYRRGSFDFLAAYVIPEDAWYILPARLIAGKEHIYFFPNSPTAKYEKYREAWDLLREAAEGGADSAMNEEAGTEEVAKAHPGAIHPADALERMRAVENFVRCQMGTAMRKRRDDDA